jgi:hypothetical protein
MEDWLGDSIEEALQVWPSNGRLSNKLYSVPFLVVWSIWLAKKEAIFKGKICSLVQIFYRMNNVVPLDENSNNHLSQKVIWLVDLRSRELLWILQWCLT